MSASDAGKVVMAVIDWVPEGFDIVSYAEERFDLKQRLLIVWEIGKGKKHWHIVGTVAKHKQGHAPDWQVDHPLKTGHGQKASRPIRISRNPKEPDMWFQYCCKCWTKTDGDCLVKAWNLTDEEMQLLGEASDEYVKSFREDIAEKCLALELKDDARTMHADMIEVHLQAYDAKDKNYHPSIKMSSLTLLSRRDQRYRPYIRQQFM